MITYIFAYSYLLCSPSILNRLICSYIHALHPLTFICAYFKCLQHFEFEKAVIPKTKEAKLDMIKKLGKYDVSVSQYEHCLKQKEIKQLVKDLEMNIDVIFTDFLG